MRSDAAAFNAAQGLTANASLGETLWGFYGQVGFDLLSLSTTADGQALTPFLRWEQYDTQSTVPAGFSRTPAREVKVLTLGLSYQPLDQIIFKADFDNIDNEADTGVNQLNLGFGYIF